jgi:CHASE3 domain sensor protein
MSTIQKNKLEVLIKIRNLSKGLHSKWQLLDDAKLMTENMLKEAQTVIKLHGSEVGKDSFQPRFE